MLQRREEQENMTNIAADWLITSDPGHRGLPIGTDEDDSGAVGPPYYTACPNPSCRK